jgi:signal peptidase I
MKETIKTIFYAGLIAIIFRTFFFEPFNIPSGSMKPTLLIGDYLFVAKYSYGYSRYSLPYGLNLIKNRIFAKELNRGDVVVFKLPKDTRTGQENKIDYIKRVIGLPGDKIQVKNNVLHINGEPVKREQIEDFIERDELGNVKRYKQFIETLPEGVQHKIIERAGNFPALEIDTRNTKEYIVPQNHYFMMGDNRDNSRDSRFDDVGYIPFVNIEGNAKVLFYSVDENTRFWELWEVPASVRWNRIFDRIM